MQEIQTKVIQHTKLQNSPLTERLSSVFAKENINLKGGSDDRR